ncbi:4-hydroxy-2-oxoheptanedioate aldolase [Anaerobiospirillum succiniciproducens]|uniref:4-hydroxy-2-oxoheptanedioate aldolase n=1 Tax=Anaerobiospirillum succiniciproducens TaxID=13335 RepID=UPI00248F2D0F|nr:4-hydroxy-2-oxoheptanedioate aldolase [Anaerobiospirillum succiniciproducens]
MELFKNTFKHNLQQGKLQLGMWLGLANSYTAELLACTGYDFLLIDGEHAPNDVRSVLPQLQAIAPYSSAPVVRPNYNDPVLLKMYLDIGAQSFLIPMIQNKEQAIAAVRATRYPPEGIRGVGSALARASRWNNVEGYLHKANEEICVLVQVETKEAVDNLDKILSVEGVDGVFIGPADLSADMGYMGNPNHEQVVKTIEECVKKIKTAGKAPGILMANEQMAKHYIELGALFVAIGVDTTLLSTAAKSLLSKYKDIELKTDKNSVY